MASKAMGLNAEGIHFERQCEKQTFYLVKELFFKKKLTNSHKKKKEKSKLVELEVPCCLSSPSGPFSKPTSLKMTFIDFHSMRVILQNEDGRVRERNLPGVTRGIGVLRIPSCFICSVSCIQKPVHWGSVGSSVSWSELEYSILIDQFMCSFIQQTFIEQSCPRHWRY